MKNEIVKFLLIFSHLWGGGGDGPSDPEVLSVLLRLGGGEEDVTDGTIFVDIDGTGQTVINATGEPVGENEYSVTISG